MSVGARSIEVRGIVQGVGFRPWVWRLARAHGLAGWVRNSGDGVSIHVEGGEEALVRFGAALAAEPPPAAELDALRSAAAPALGLTTFEIRPSETGAAPTARVSPDLAVCADCLRDLFDPADRHFHYPYVNCASCGPRHSIVLALPYDRERTTMRAWRPCAACAAEFHDPANRRFHAQPIACPACGPHYAFEGGGVRTAGEDAAGAAARALAAGRIVAVKGLGGFHLACDARDARAVRAVRERKFRKEQPFALLVRDAAVAATIVEVDAATRALLESPARPIVLAPARVELAGVAPDTAELGVMLASTPLHHLLFAGGAPPVLVMTSGNRSSEPIAYRDDEARARLAGIADDFLVGERPIARRIDDSVTRVVRGTPVVRRLARGLAPARVARLPGTAPILAVGADLKSSITLVIEGEAHTSQHLGDLDDADSRAAFRAAVEDLTAMYGAPLARTIVAHDLHPAYASTRFALELPACAHVAVQHHRAHVAAALAERGALERPVIGVVFDGTGWGDDGAIWGGEIFAGSVAAGFTRVAHLLEAPLPGGDAAARHPVQAAAGWLDGVAGIEHLEAPPFDFPPRWRASRALVAAGVRVFRTTSAGRLFDTVAALLGFTRPISFEGQAAMWLEQLAGRAAETRREHAAPDEDATRDGSGALDPRPLLARVIAARRDGRDLAEIARSFHEGLAARTAQAAILAARPLGTQVVVLSGGVMQNALLVEAIRTRLAAAGLETWTHARVPANDGGISLGQAAIAACLHDRAFAVSRSAGKENER